MAMSTEDIDPTAGPEGAEPLVLQDCYNRQQRGWADKSTLYLVSSPGRIRIFPMFDYQLRVSGNIS